MRLLQLLKRKILGLSRPYFLKLHVVAGGPWYLPPGQPDDDDAMLGSAM